METWQKNLRIVWVAQFMSACGFCFARPLAPFLLQDMGVTDPDRLKMYTAFFGAAAPVSLVFFSPIWGSLADRFGRRIMMMRANFGAGIALALMGMAGSAGWFVAFRVMQGIFSGTMPAAQAFISANTPDEKGGYALGILSTAMFSGTMAGYFLGGMFAELLGYRTAFYVASLFLLAGGSLVLLALHEDFEPPVKKEGPVGQPKTHASLNDPIILIYILIFAVAFTRQFDLSFFPLFVQEIHGRLEGAAIWTGLLSAAGGMAGFLSGLVFGRLSEHHSPTRIGMISAAGGAVFMFLHASAGSLGMLFPYRFALMLFAGGLDLLFQILLSKSSQRGHRGSVFGWAASVRALAWVGSPLVSGAVASHWGLPAIYHVGGLAFLLLIPLIFYAERRINGESNHI